MTEAVVLTAVSLSALHHPAEDRLVIVATANDGTQRSLMLTRRLSIRLVNGFAHLLERTSSVAAEASQHARGNIVMFEHQGALAIGKHSATAPPASGFGPVPPRNSAAITRAQDTSLLLQAIDITVTQNLFVMVLQSGGRAVARMEVTRTDLHRLLALLRRKCDEAAWRVPIETAWLDIDAGSMTLN